MAIAYETSTTPQATILVAAGGTNNVTCAMGSGTDRVALVAVHWRDRGNNVTGVTINGTSMTAAGAQVTNGNDLDSARLFYLVSPTSGSQTVAVTYSAGEIDSLAQVSCWVASGVDQTTPISNYASNFGSGAGASIVSSVTITSATNNLAAAFHSTWNTTAVITATPTNYTERQDGDDASGCSAEFGDAAGAASVATSATWSNGAYTVSWVALGINVNAAAAGPAANDALLVIRKA